MCMLVKLEYEKYFIILKYNKTIHSEYYSQSIMYEWKYELKKNNTLSDFWKCIKMNYFFQKDKLLWIKSVN